MFIEVIPLYINTLIPYQLVWGSCILVYLPPSSIAHINLLPPLFFSKVPPFHSFQIHAIANRFKLVLSHSNHVPEIPNITRRVKTLDIFFCFTFLWCSAILSPNSCKYLTDLIRDIHFNGSSQRCDTFRQISTVSWSKWPNIISRRCHNPSFFIIFSIKSFFYYLYRFFRNLAEIDEKLQFFCSENHEINFFSIFL